MISIKVKKYQAKSKNPLIKKKKKQDGGAKMAEE